MFLHNKREVSYRYLILNTARNRDKYPGLIGKHLINPPTDAIYKRVIEEDYHREMSNNYIE